MGCPAVHLIQSSHWCFGADTNTARVSVPAQRFGLHRSTLSAQTLVAPGRREAGMDGAE